MFKSRERAFSEALNRYLAGRKHSVGTGPELPEEGAVGLCVCLPSEEELLQPGTLEQLGPRERLDRVLLQVKKELEYRGGAGYPWQWVYMQGETFSVLSLEQMQGLCRALGLDGYRSYMSVELRVGRVENGFLAGLKMLGFRKVVAVCANSREWESAEALLKRAKGINMAIELRLDWSKDSGSRSSYIHLVEEASKTGGVQIMLWPGLDAADAVSAKSQSETAVLMEKAAAVLLETGWIRHSLWLFAKGTEADDMIGTRLRTDHLSVGPGGVSWYDGYRMANPGWPGYIEAEEQGWDRQLSAYHREDAQWFALAGEIYAMRLKPRTLAIIPSQASMALRRLGVLDGTGTLSAEGTIFCQIVGRHALAEMYYDEKDVKQPEQPSAAGNKIIL